MSDKSPQPKEDGAALHTGEAIALASIMVGGLILRLCVLGAHPHIEADGYFYLKIAEQFRAGGNPFHPLFHPFYPILIAGAEWFVRDPERAGRLVSAVTGTLTILPAAFLARRLFDSRIALGTAVLVAVHPLLVLASTYVLCEATYALLITTAAALVLRAMDDRSGRPLPFAGLLLGAAYLARPEGLLLAPVLFGWWLAAMWGQPLRRKAALAWAGLGLATTVLVALPYLVYLRTTSGMWTLSGKVAHNFALDSGLAAAPTRLGDLLAQTAGIAHRYARNLFVADKYTLPALFPPVLMLLLALGLFAVRPQAERDKRAIAFLFSLWLPTLVVPLFHIETRVFVPYLATGLILVARGACWFGARRTPEDGHPSGAVRREWPIWLVLGVVSLLVLPHAVRPLLVREPREEIYREAGTWIAAHAPDSRRIMDRKPYVAFYSGRAFEPIPPKGNVGEVLALARQRGVDLLVIDVELVQGDRPEVEPLTIPALAPRGLELVRAFDSPEGRPLLLYRLTSP
jgi:4-amino-4-deoxy-L-arabinose transferase-like glycosyltransferase